MTPTLDNLDMPPTESDIQWMSLALTWAEKAMYITTPNPRVGCVIVNSQGVLIGSGHTQAAGQAHAEIMALQDAKQQGHAVTGATAYVTLEPCNHQGRTGPCCDALIQAGLARVVVAEGDPNPQVAGQGISRLRAAGVQVYLGLLGEEAHELNIGFFSRTYLREVFARVKAVLDIYVLSTEPKFLGGPEAVNAVPDEPPPPLP